MSQYYPIISFTFPPSPVNDTTRTVVSERFILGYYQYSWTIIEGDEFIHIKVQNVRLGILQNLIEAYHGIGGKWKKEMGESAFRRIYRELNEYIYNRDSVLEFWRLIE